MMEAQSNEILLELEDVATKRRDSVEDSEGCRAEATDFVHKMLRESAVCAVKERHGRKDSC